MSQRNVPILLLLGGGESKNDQSLDQHPYRTPSQNARATPSPQPNLGPSSPYRPNPILNLVTQFQPQAENRPPTSQEPIVIDDERPPPPDIVVVDDNNSRSKAQVPLAPSYGRPSPLNFDISLITGNQSGAMLEYIKNFQSNFKVTTAESLTGDKPASPLTWPKKTGPSKTSINSIINSEESAAAPPEKKKRASSAKSDTASKKAKTEAAKKAKTEVKTEPSSGPKKPGPKSKKKTPEIIIAPSDKPAIHPTATTDKARAKNAPVKLEKPSIVSLKKDEALSDKKDKDTPLEDKKEKSAPPPIIALNIPLLDPKAPLPGQAEVVVNVLKLAEDKYGWKTIHTNAKSAIDLMDEMLDDEDDGADEDDDDEVQMVDEKGNALNKKKNNEEMTEEQLIRKRETKMNRKVGKYDYEDPFIDDEELQWEEEITTTKEGFFVYWGPLVEDRTSTTTAKKSTTKSKK